MRKSIVTFLTLVILTIVGCIMMWYHAGIPIEELKENYTSSNSKYYDWRGAAVHYKTVGQDNLNSKPPLLLLHGTGSSSHTWEEWMSRLSTDFSITAVDLPSFGLTGPTDDGAYELNDFMTFLDDFTAHLNMDSLFLGGNSLGGYYAWNYALRQPDRVKKLILSNSAGYPSNNKKPMGFRLAQSAVFGPLIKKITPRWIVEKTLIASFSDPELVTEEMVDRYYKLLLRKGNRAAYVSRVNQNNASIDTSQIRKIDCPTLIMWGVDDRVIPAVHAFKFLRDIEKGDLRLYPEVGHLPMEEIPEVSALDVKAFLEALPKEADKQMMVDPHVG